MLAAMRRASSRVNRRVAPADAIEMGAFLRGSQAEHTLFDLRHFRAPVVRGDGDYSVAHVKPTRYGFPVGVLEADFFIHADFDAFVLLFPFVVAFNEMILANTGPQSTQW